MKKVLPWLGLGLLAASFGGSSFACSSDDSGGGATGGAGGGFTDGGFGATGGGPGATGRATGGTGGGTVATKLAKACVNDGECGAGLTCITPDSAAWDGEGPAHGYCTATCTAAADCAAFDPTAECVSFDGTQGYCLSGCTVGAPFGPGKCQGRADVGCNQFLRGTAVAPCGANNACPAGQACATDGQCHETFSACAALCAIDADCPTGHTCNPGSGLCTTTAPTGKDLGQSCKSTPSGTPGECKGFCVGVTGTTERFCSQLCVVGVPNSCGWAGPGNKGDALCGLVFDQAATAGDVGACSYLCDCNADCPTGYICEPDADVQTNVLRAGSCSPATGADAGAGIVSCTDAGTGGTGGTDAGTGGTDAGTGGTGTGGTGTGGTDAGTGGAPADAGNG